MPTEIRGDPVEFEFVSSDATTAAPLVLRRSGSRESITLGANERLVIEQMHGYILQNVGPQDDITAQIIADSDEDGDYDAGDLMAVIGGGTVDPSFTPTGMDGALGIIPKVLASAAGFIQLTGNGYIMKG